LIEFPGSGKGL